ncbi:tetratricopeptide repeat protein [Stenotrophomonas sp. C3(2023)]|uniref:tetratricopeptide repeat protein n=1 Tax=Stenotrophomonas sp. C3(2023) TaxID=3080277 RepID=UPI00293C8EBD|nr:tetratricopeptide repeat protein [Stenotrophomonas sp. C3(2023)]MDV3467286.1 tetratricopeptide repeat protein [Stenotrophomonas sp. C3(2023)]
MTVAVRWVVGVMLAALAGAAWGETTLAPPQEFYFDNDPAAQVVEVVKGEGNDLVNQLMRQRERGRKQLEATVQLASVAIGQGRVELGESLYAEALKSGALNSPQGRQVRWNYGWDLYRLGRYDAALEQWNLAADALRGNAAWAPPTYAVALWQLGRRDEAVQWYAAAARTEPAQWSGSDRFAALLPTWRESERATLKEVQQAWAANPPAWP